MAAQMITLIGMMVRIFIAGRGGSIFIDLPPWHPEADLQPVSGLVQDADYDFISHFSLEIDYSSFTPGYHRIFLQAWDTEADGNSSNPGLIEAVDIFIPYQCFIPLVNSE